ncbi:MAG TPA: hypothetical protein VE263_15100 [Candidatus Angelobacter sp.]|nr:hypothetical protein [Candidatus Angelobacter sp.]
MPKGLEQHHGGGDLQFLTFGCYRRLPFLGRIRERYKFLLVGYVVMLTRERPGKKPHT